MSMLPIIWAVVSVTLQGTNPHVHGVMETQEECIETLEFMKKTNDLVNYRVSCVRYDLHQPTLEIELSHGG